MPLILRDLTLDGSRPVLDRVLNPLPSGLVWIRGMDAPPTLTTLEALQERERETARWASDTEGP
jgi:hypothetical protein